MMQILISASSVAVPQHPAGGDEGPCTQARGIIDESERKWARKVHKQLILETLATHSVDMIHMHSLDFHHYLPDDSVPLLATLHLPPDWYPASIFDLKRKNFYLNCVYFSQQEPVPKATICCPRFRMASTLQDWTAL